MSGFDEAVEKLLDLEGGLVEHSADPGELTNFGISRRSYPDLDIRGLTRADAIEIYRADWWRRYGLGSMPGPVGAQMLLVATSVGPVAAFRILQRALNAAGRFGLTEDGIYGPRTRQALASADAGAVVAAMRSETARYYEALIHQRPDLKVFRRGWLRRAYA